MTYDQWKSTNPGKTRNMDMPDRIYAERDATTNAKRWYSTKGMGVEYVRKALISFQAAEEGLGPDHWLVSGRIDGIREALETMRSGISCAEAEERLEHRISELMKLD